MKKHWTPTYILNRIKTGIYWKLNQDKPWLTKKANEYLDKNLNKQMVGLEFGSGRSTIFFAKKLNKLISVENNKEWYTKVQSLLEEQKIKNVDYRIANVDNDNPDISDYHNIIDEFNDEYFDFILVDGVIRDLCALKAVCKLKSGGLLVIDNVNWFFPSNSIAPNSVPIDGTLIGRNWSVVYGKIKNWKKIWTTNGVTDTAIYIKP